MSEHARSDNTPEQSPTAQFMKDAADYLSVMAAGRLDPPPSSRFRTFSSHSESSDDPRLPRHLVEYTFPVGEDRSVKLEVRCLRDGSIGIHCESRPQVIRGFVAPTELGGVEVVAISYITTNAIFISDPESPYSITLRNYMSAFRPQPIPDAPGWQMSIAGLFTNRDSAHHFADKTMGARVGALIQAGEEALAEGWLPPHIRLCSPGWTPRDEMTAEVAAYFPEYLRFLLSQFAAATGAQPFSAWVEARSPQDDTH